MDSPGNPDSEYQTITSYYPNQGKQYEITTKDAKIHSLISYHQSGAIYTSLTLTDAACLTFSGEEYSEDSKLLYKGNFINGKKNLLGTSYNTFTNTKIYDGEWLDNAWNGQGTEFFTNGNKSYQGHFRKGLKNGFGTSYSIDSTKLYEGNWKDDNYFGKGCYYNEHGNPKFFSPKN
jgi:hypothetical protein